MPCTGKPLPTQCRPGALVTFKTFFMAHLLGGDGRVPGRGANHGLHPVMHPVGQRIPDCSICAINRMPAPWATSHMERAPKGALICFDAGGSLGEADRQRGVEWRTWRHERDLVAYVALDADRQRRTAFAPGLHH